MNENTEKNIVANPLIVLREEVDHWAILIDPDTGNTFGLNPIGVLIWKHFDGHHTLEEITDKIRGSFDDVPFDVSSHVQNFVRNAVMRGLVHNKVLDAHKSLGIMKSPSSVDLEITGACNLRCDYCSHFSGPGDVEKDMPLEAWRMFFSELKNCAVTSVTLSGGEPFYRPDIRAIIESIVANRLRFSILSNGTLIDRDMAEFLASTGHCDLVQVSIDGAIDITHDAFRGKGNFMKAIQGIKALQQFNVPTTVRVTIHRKNVHELEAIAKLLLAEIKLPSFSTNSASHMGLCRKNAAQTQLTIAERSLAMETMMLLADKYEGRINATAGPLADAGSWLEMQKAYRNGKQRMKGRGFLTGCNGPSRTLAVRADGVMIPCLQLGHMALGRINHDDFLSIWQNHPDLQLLRQRSTISLSSFNFCRGCVYTDFCTGNCPAMAYTIAGEVNHPSPDACLRLFLEKGGRLPERSARHRTE